MNILFVTPSLPDRGQPTTGFHTYLYKIGYALIELGHKPIILSAGDRDEKWNDRGIEVIRVRAKLGSNYTDTDCAAYIIGAFKKSYILYENIKKLEKKYKIDIIQFTSLEGVALSYFGRVPSIMRLSSYSKTFYIYLSRFSKRHIWAMAFVERMASRRCNAVLSPCKNTADAFGKDVKRKVYTIETPYFDDIDVNDYDYECFEKHLKGKKYALFFGTLYVIKGIKVIGECLEKFLENNKEYYFVFAGKVMDIEGENSAKYLKRCAGKYADRVIFLSELTHNLLYPVIVNADFVVLPSIVDNLPNACIEAMHFGKIVVGTDGSSIEQLIVHKKSGFLCRIGDSHDLLDKMQMAVDMKPDEKLEMSKNAKKCTERLKPEIAVNKLVDFYNKVIDNSERGK